MPKGKTGEAISHGLTPKNFRYIIPPRILKSPGRYFFINPKTEDPFVIHPCSGQLKKNPILKLEIQ